MEPAAAIGAAIQATAAMFVPRRVPDHPGTVRIQSPRTADCADNGAWAPVDRVLSERVAVLDAWIGTRAECLRRAP